LSRARHSDRRWPDGGDGGVLDREPRLDLPAGGPDREDHDCDGRGAAGLPASAPEPVRRPPRHGGRQSAYHPLRKGQWMILTPGIIARLAVLGVFAAVAQVVCFSKMDVFGTSPDIALLIVVSIGLLGGSLTGSVAGFSIGLLTDCLLLEKLGG